jgi:hypothetical protein
MAKGTTLSKQRPPEDRIKQNASRAGRTFMRDGVQRTLLLQPKPTTAAEEESLKMDQALIGRRKAAEAEHAAGWLLLATSSSLPWSWLCYIRSWCRSSNT